MTEGKSFSESLKGLVDDSNRSYVELINAQIRFPDDIRFTHEKIVQLTDEKLEGNVSSRSPDSLPGFSPNKKVSRISGRPTKSLDMRLLKYFKRKLKELESAFLQDLPTMAASGKTPETNRAQYTVPSQLVHMKFESMPVDVHYIRKIHRESNISSLKMLKRGMELYSIDAECDKITRAMQRSLSQSLIMRNETELRRVVDHNNSLSLEYCSKLIQFLHQAVLLKVKEEKKGNLTVDLLNYHSNIESLISQYGFLSKGPCAAPVKRAFLIQCTSLDVKAMLKSHECMNQTELHTLKSCTDECHVKLLEFRSTIDNMSQEKDRRMELARKKLSQLELSRSETLNTLNNSLSKVESSLLSKYKEKDSLLKDAVSYARITVDSIHSVGENESRKHAGYLFRLEKGSFGLKKSWKQSFFVIEMEQRKLLCYKSKDSYEKNDAPREEPIFMDGLSLVEIERPNFEFQLVDIYKRRNNGLQFRATSKDGYEAWILRLKHVINGS